MFVYFFLPINISKPQRDLTIMFISHLLATREVEADQGTQTNEGREIKDEEDVLCHAARPKKLKPNYK